MITVTLPNKVYQVKIETAIRSHLGSEISKVWSPRQVMVISDENVAGYYLDETVTQLTADGFIVSTAVVPAGEHSKSLVQVGDIINQMAEAGFTRGDGVIALGGGVIGDLSGVVASLYMRGIAFIQIATSLTAMVDSSVGGKTAVNLDTVKNIAGTFYQPDLVLIDITYLQTLEDRDLIEGYAEVIKTSALDGADFFALTGTIRSSIDIREHAVELVSRSVAYKARIVMADEKEGGVRKFLNFGHTVGHAIELLAHGDLRHGEAIAIGMATISAKFERDGITKTGMTQELIDRLKAVGLPIKSNLIGSDAFYEHMKNDKKNRGGILQLVAVSKVGEPIIVNKPLVEMSDFLK